MSLTTQTATSCVLWSSRYLSWYNRFHHLDVLTQCLAPLAVTKELPLFRQLSRLPDSVSWKSGVGREQALIANVAEDFAFRRSSTRWYWMTSPYDFYFYEMIQLYILVTVKNCTYFMRNFMILVWQGWYCSGRSFGRLSLQNQASRSVRYLLFEVRCQ